MFIVYNKHKVEEKQLYLEKKAYAKINLVLDVIRKLETGYHEVKMIMQTVDIYDSLYFEKIEQGIELSVDGVDLGDVKENLIYRAAQLLLEKSEQKEGVSIRLKKEIPVAAGMAGGSSDAAATFHAINELFDLGYSIPQLQEIAVSLGADIPYCIVGGTALAEGIGEKLTSITAPPDCFLVVAKPDINVSTPFVYQNLKLNELESHPNVDAMIRAIEESSLEGMVEAMDNVLETVTISHYPIIEELKKSMISLGAMGALMSGSGPTVFGIFQEEETAQKCKQEILNLQLAKQVFVTTFKHI